MINSQWNKENRLCGKITEAVRRILPPSIRFGGETILFYLRPQIFKTEIVEKLFHRNFQPVTQFLERNNPNILSVGPHKTINGGGGYAGNIGKLIECDVPLFAYCADTLHNSFLHTHKNHPIV